MFRLFQTSWSPARFTVRCLCSEAFEPSIKKGLVLGCYTGEKGIPLLTKAAAKYNEHSGGKLLELAKEAGPEIKRASGRVFNNIDPDYWSVCLVGLGPKELGYNPVEMIDEDREAVRCAAAIGALKLQKNGCHCVCVEGMGYPEQAAEGAAMAVWRYQENKNKKHHRIVPQLELFEDPDQDAWQRGLFKAESQNFVRMLSDAPPNLMTPLHLAQAAVNELCPCGIKVDVRDKDWIESKRMDCFLTVARGSCAPPLFLEMAYCGGPSEQKPIMLVGKGVTFDSGGLCLRECKDMLERRADMAGAAVIMAVIRAASALSLPINIIGLAPLCENMPSGMAMKVGDVVMGLNGKSVRIEDTDNDGRLLLADALVYGQSTYKPRLVIDVATETSGIKAALGSSAAGVFSNSHSMWKQIRKAGIVSGDRVWRMPLWKFFTNNVTQNRTVDVANKGVGKGSACLAAAFLKEFITCVDWMHVDIEGVGMKCYDKAYPYYRKGRMTGRPTRTLIQLLYQLACPEKK